MQISLKGRMNVAAGSRSKGFSHQKEKNPGASTSRFLPQGSEEESAFSLSAIAALDLGGIEANLLDFLKLSRASG